MARKCAFAGCDATEGLVELVHEPTESEYKYCDDHDPRDDGSTWGYAEADR